MIMFKNKLKIAIVLERVHWVEYASYILVIDISWEF